MSVSKYFAVFLFFITLQFSSVCFAQGYRMKTIVIDAGHGGEKPGAKGQISWEKDVSLQVALKLGKKIQEEIPNIKVIQTRTTDVDVDWYKRADIANDAKADLFISIHCNSSPSKAASGTETFVGAYRRINEMDAGLKENEEIIADKRYKQKGAFNTDDPEANIMLSIYKSMYRTKGLSFASAIQSFYNEGKKRPNRGVKEQGILILQRAAMPSVLTEIGFISNTEEEKYINSAEGQAEIVSAIVNAIKQYKKEVEI
jgi:N-acetylmuramoyl-L-alanine amidase